MDTQAVAAEPAYGGKRNYSHRKNLIRNFLASKSRFALILIATWSGPTSVVSLVLILDSGLTLTHARVQNGVFSFQRSAGLRDIPSCCTVSLITK